jgi:uncharacterized membrane protein
MFLIFKIFPTWFWWLLLASGLSAFLVSYLPQAKAYALVLKVLGLVVVSVSIFIFGLLCADNTWKAAAAELEAKVAVLAEQANTVNEVVKEKTITKVQLVKVRGQDVVQYVDREVVKYDNTCVIPAEFVTAHNRAVEAPK